MTDQGISVSQGTAPDVVGHTPGPWEINPLQTVEGEFMICAGQGHDYGLVATAADPKNAALIADAPDMLATIDDLQLALSGANKDWNAAMLRAHAAESRVSVLEGALEDALEFIDDHVDVVDGSYGEPAPNRAMSLASSIRERIETRTRSLPVNAGSTSSDGGASNSTAPGETGADKRSSADAQASSGASVVAGVRPGPSETLSPSTARVADREAIAEIVRWASKEALYNGAGNVINPEIFDEAATKISLLDKGGDMPKKEGMDRW